MDTWYLPVTLLFWSLVLSQGAQQGPTSPRPRDFARCVLSLDLREQFVDIHNEVRGQVNPPAADMEFLVWDQELGNLAQMWSNKCEWMHGFLNFGTSYRNPAYRKKSVGQNLSREWGKWVQRSPPPSEAVRRWFKEKQYYTYGKFTYPMPRSMCRRYPCGHYTQVVWSQSKTIGCALKWCDKYFGRPHPWVPGETIVTCDYIPSGNVMGQLPYKVGRPCSKCASGKGWCYKNLCRECKDFSPKCGRSYTKSMCLTQRDVMEKYCPRMCSLCKCAITCQNGGRLDRNTCTCICSNQWHGSTCSERCVDNMGTSSCQRLLQRGQRCSTAHMKARCAKTCICARRPKPRPQPPRPRPQPQTRPPHPATAPPATQSPRPKPDGECRDQFADPWSCPDWAAKGKCKKYPKWMRDHCKKSCGICNCNDKINTVKCRTWAARGECSKNQAWMEINCSKSCEACDCHDNNTGCKVWASKHDQCTKNPKWMLENCKKSCKRC